MVNLADLMFELLSGKKYFFQRDAEFEKNNTPYCYEAYRIIPKNGSKPFYLTDGGKHKNIAVILRETQFADEYVPTVFDYYTVSDGCMELYSNGLFVDSIII